MEAFINRTYFDDATLGFFSISGLVDPIFPTIERPWLKNANDISCIPEGVYKVKPFTSPDHVDVWEICDVPNRFGVLIHSANWVEQLKGCVAPGLSSGYMLRDGKNKKAVRDSGLAISQMKILLKYPAEFQLTIRS